MHQQFISDEDIFNYMYNALIKYGYTPDSDMLLDVTEMIFDFMIDAGIVELMGD